MPVTAPIKTNFLYRFTAGSNDYLFTNIAEDQVYNNETYEFIQIEHTSPKFSAEASDAEIDAGIIESSAILEIFINGPPAYPVILTISEYDRDTGIATPYYKGWVVRPNMDLNESTTVFRVKSLWHFFERESFTDSLAALSRYSIYDPRSGVIVDTLKVAVIVTALNSERDVLTVTGITQIDDYFTAGMIVAPDGNKRTILRHVTELGAKKLYLNGAFPLFTMAAGFAADIYPGDDLTYAKWANTFAAETNNGEAFGGWPFMPNVDPAVRGVI